MACVGWWMGVACSLLSPSRSRQLALDVYQQVAREGFKLNNGLKAALVRCFYRCATTPLQQPALPLPHDELDPRRLLPATARAGRVWA